MAAHAEGHHAPDREVVTLHDVAWRIAWVLGAQQYLPGNPLQALAQRFAVDGGNHDMAMARLDRAVDQHQVAIEDTGALHAVAVYSDQIDMRCAQVEQLVQRNRLLHVVGGWRRKTRRDAEQIARHGSTAARDETQDGSHETALILNCMHIQ